MMVEISLIDGTWKGTGHASTYKPEGVPDFFLDAEADTPTEVVNKLAAQL